MPEINPRTASHFLVNAILLFALRAIDCIQSVSCAFRQRSVRHIDRIRPVCRNIRCPRSLCYIFILFSRGNFPIRTVSKGIVKFHIRFFLITESDAPIFPYRFRKRGFRITARSKSSVIVHYYFDRINVALARAEHVCARILEHRHQKRHHIALRIQILDSVEYSCTLPLPTVCRLLEIETVTLPHRYYFPVKAFLRMRQFIHRIHKRLFMLRRSISKFGVIIKQFNVLPVDSKCHFIT